MGPGGPGSCASFAGPDLMQESTLPALDSSLGSTLPAADSAFGFGLSVCPAPGPDDLSGAAVPDCALARGCDV